MRGAIGKKVIFAAMLIALAFRLPLAWKGPEVLIPKVVSDDMFYYLDIARNMADGRGATIDGENVSNGFHFLYAALLVPLAKISGDDKDLFVRLALSLLTLLSILSAWPLYRLLRSRCSEPSALFAGVFWLCSPFTVLICLSGVEVPVFVFVLSFTSLAYVKMKEKGEYPLSRWAALGLLAGLVILARLDGAILAAIIALELFFLLSRRRQALAFCAGTLACVSPWFLWSYLRTGYILQVSGKAIRCQTHLLFQRGGGGAGAWLRQVAGNFVAGIDNMTILCGMSATTFFIICAVVLFFLIGLSILRKKLAREWLGRARPLIFLPVYGVVTLLLYAAWLWYTQNWYYYSVFFSGCVILGLLLDFFDCGIFSGKKIYRTVFWVALSCLLLISSLRLNARWWKRGIRWWQEEMYRATLWCGDNLPEEARIGSFNSGMLGYYSGRTVINLDGVVNPGAYEAMSANRSFDYIESENIRYIVETPRSLLFRSLHCGRDIRPHLRAIHRESILPGNNVTVFEVK